MKTEHASCNILGSPDTENGFMIDEEASKTGIGVLSQRRRDHCVTTRELLAAVKLLQNFSKYRGSC